MGFRNQFAQFFLRNQLAQMPILFSGFLILSLAEETQLLR
jgi:hypothetical protein